MHTVTLPSSLDDAAPSRPLRRVVPPTPLNPTPTVRRFVRDDKPMVEVGLSGAYGAGKQMILDADDWDAASAKYGSAWSLVGNGTGKDYVRAGRAALRGAAQQPRSHGNATLGRLLLDVDPGEVVVYRNGNALDLSRPNLLKLSRAEAATWRREREAERVIN